jgi:hypothetical protein
MLVGLAFVPHGNMACGVLGDDLIERAAADAADAARRRRRAPRPRSQWSPLQDVLEAWTATVRLQRQPGYEAMIERMQRRERGVPVDLDELRRPRG